MDVEIISDYYRSSPLVQGGLEIKYKVTVKVPSATPRQVTERYCALVKELYVEPKEEETLGSFIVVNDSEIMYKDFSIHQMSSRPRKQPSKPNESTIKSKDIRTFLNKRKKHLAHACTEKKL